MPFYYRNADGDELVFVHRGEGIIETDFGPLTFEKGDYLNIPRAVTHRFVPQTTDNFFLIIQSRTEFEQPDKGLLGQHALYDPAVIVDARARRRILDDNREWEVRIKVEDEILEGLLSVQSARRRGMEGRPDGVEDQHARHPAGDEPSRAPAAERAHHVRHRRRGGLQFLPRPLEQDPEALRVPFFHRNTDYDEFLFYHDGDFFSQDNIKRGHGDAASARHPSRTASQGAGEPDEENAHRRIRRHAGRPESHPRAAGRRTGGVEGLLDELDGSRSRRSREVIVDPATTAAANIYKLMVGVIVPAPHRVRLDAQRRRRAQPGAVQLLHRRSAPNPPVICFSPMIRGATARERHAAQHRGDAGVRSQRRVGGFRAADESLLAPEYPPEVDEFEASGLTADSERPGEAAARGRIARQHGVPAATRSCTSARSRWEAAS